MELENEEEVIRAAMSAIGRRKSERKTAAARENAKLGGKPKGSTLTQQTKEKMKAAQIARWERVRQEKAATRAKDAGVHVASKEGQAEG